LDASAVLAVLYREPGADKLPPELLAKALMSSVNLAEVQSKLVALGWDADQAWKDCTGFVDQVVPFTMEQAKRTGDLVSATRSLGLSLGDRVCLALALEQNAPVYTTDRSWRHLKLDLKIIVLR
jgi:PIN domain nuclease of toxin-antitoxin system